MQELDPVSIGNLASVIDFLGVLYLEAGREKEAEPVLRRALSMREKAFGPGAASLSYSLTHLGNLYEQQGRFDEAEAAHKSAIEIGEKTLGLESPDVSAFRANLAVVYSRRFKFGEAEQIFRRDLAVTEKTYGPDHPLTGNCLVNLANIYSDQKRKNELIALYRRALAVFEKAYGADHPLVALTLGNLAAHLDNDELEALFKRALAVDQKIYGQNHPRTAKTLHRLGQYYLGKQRYQDAERVLRGSLDMALADPSQNADAIAQSQAVLAHLLREEGKYAEAEGLFKQSTEFFEKALGPNHPVVDAMRGYIASVYFYQQDWARSLTILAAATDLTARRMLLSRQSFGQGLTDYTLTDVLRENWMYTARVKASFRAGGASDAESTASAFQIAQWVGSSETAGSIAEMAARHAAGKPALAPLIRNRQDLAAEWRTKNGLLVNAASQPPEGRDLAAEQKHRARMTDIDRQIMAIDERLEAEFPDYASLTSPAPLSIADVQALLAPTEALVFFLDTSELKPTPEETFIWVLTKTDRRWVRSDLGTAGLDREVKALRCGLDAAALAGSRCAEIMGAVYAEADLQAGNRCRSIWRARITCIRLCSDRLKTSSRVSSFACPLWSTDTTTVSGAGDRAANSGRLPHRCVACPRSRAYSASGGLIVESAATGCPPKRGVKTDDRLRQSAA